MLEGDLPPVPPDVARWLVGIAGALLALALLGPFIAARAGRKKDRSSIDLDEVGAPILHALSQMRPPPPEEEPAVKPGEPSDTPDSE